MHPSCIQNQGLCHIILLGCGCQGMFYHLLFLSFLKCFNLHFSLWLYLFFSIQFSYHIIYSVDFICHRILRESYECSYKMTGNSVLNLLLTERHLASPFLSHSSGLNH